MIEEMNNQGIMLTVHTIAYNQEHYIRDCLEGIVKQQTSFKFEAIVHDDCSTDHTADIIREYAKKYPDIIKPIYEEENQYSKGVNSQMNTKMNAFTHGKYIALCEGDDYWTDPTKLQRQVDFLEAHPDYSMCFHNAKLDNPKHVRTNFLVGKVEDKDYTGRYLFEHWMVPTASIVCRRNCMDMYFSIKHKENIINGDIVWILCCCRLGKVRGMVRTMSAYRIHGDSMMHNSASLRYRTLMLPKHNEFLACNFPEIKGEIYWVYQSIAYYDRSKLEHGNDMIKDLLKSAKCSPKTLSKVLILRYTPKRILSFFHHQH